MPAEWLSNSSKLSGWVSWAATGALQSLSQPENARRLRQLVLVLLALWVVLALARLVWGLVPATENAGAAPPQVINPVTAGHSGVKETATVDIQSMRSWHLFGEAGGVPEEAVDTEAQAQASAREGIEDGARETRLKLILRGIVARSEDGLGHAIIEYSSKQAVYAVEDKLPVPGRVVLAKVMPRQVVLDNGGTYELLVLFDDSKMGGTQPYTPPVRQQPKRHAKIDKRDDAQATKLAATYRDRLFKNPQSLAQVVSVSAVREGSQLRGYRVSPGQDTEQFAQLGFQKGDLVTAVNGVGLDNPANTMVLYNAMRTAAEVVFEVEREGQPVTISVALDEGVP